MKTNTKLAIGAALLLLSVVFLYLRLPRSAARREGSESAHASVPVAPTTEATKDDAVQSPATEGRTLAFATPAPDGSHAIDRDHDLHGRVIDPSARPVANALVEAFHNEGSGYNDLDIARAYERHKVGETRSDSDGRFAIRLELGRPYALEVEAPGYARERLPNRNAGEFVLVRLHAAASMFGRVTRASDGSPVEDARIRGWPRGGRGPASKLVLFDGRTDALGEFRLDGLAPCEMYFEVTPRVEAPPNWRRIDLAEGEAHREDVVVEAGPTIRGRVIDAKTRAPIADAEVGAAWVFNRPVHTDAAGEYEYVGFPVEGVDEIHARASGYGRAEKQVRVSKRDPFPERVDFELVRGRTVRGRVVDEQGLGLEHVRVAAVGNMQVDWIACESGVDGRFELVGLRPDGRHALSMRKEGYGTVARALPTEWKSFEIEIGDVVLAPMSVVRGELVDESGKGVPDRPVKLRANSEEGQSEVDLYVRVRGSRTDDLGRFAFADVAPGAYRLTSETPGSWKEISMSLDVPHAGTLKGLRLVVPSGLSIEGRVRLPDGQPAGSTLVSAYSATPGGSRVSAEADKEGRFRLVGLGEGTYSVSASPSSWMSDRDARSKWVQTTVPGIRTGARDVEIVLRSGGSIRGRVIDADGNAVVKSYVIAKSPAGEFRGSDTSDASGRFAIVLGLDEVVEIEAQAPYLDGPGRNKVPQTRTISDFPRASVAGIVPGGNEVVLQLAWRP